MKRGFTVFETKELARRIAILHGSFDALINELREKHTSSEEWFDDRSEKWQESEASEEFQDCMNEIDSKADELESLKDDISLGFLEEIL